jgi:manganese/zinc/iron transport system permease protein
MEWLLGMEWLFGMEWWFGDESRTLRIVTLGTALLGALSGSMGCFAVLRRQSLLGDAVSHAALPGIVLAYMLSGQREIGVLLLGAAVAGWLAVEAVRWIARDRRIPFESALAAVLAIFFGIGIALLTYAQRHYPGATQAGLERFLFGQASTLLLRDVIGIALVAGLSWAVVLLFWPPLHLLTFDPQAAELALAGSAWLNRLLAVLLVTAVIIGLSSVGAVLMSALLIAPAVAARQWVHRLGPMLWLAGAFGALAGVAGTLTSHLLSQPGRAVPTGPTIVLWASAFVGGSLLIAPGRGLVWQRSWKHTNSTPS